MNLGPKKKSGDLRDLARRMAAGLSQAADRARVNHYADELEKQAAELEAQGPPVPSQPTVTHQQQQVQQQQSLEPIDPEKTKK
jgi:hypothetical protein